MSMIEEMQSFECFTNSEKAIIDVIFRDPDTLPEMTAQELAKKAYTSTSTVVRLCQKLDCKTYNEFRTKLVAEMQLRRNGNVHVDANVPFEKEDSSEEMLRKITDLHLNTVNETLALLDRARYEHAVAMLAHADCIDIYGRGMNVHLAYDFAYKMMRIGRRVEIFVDYEHQIINAVRKYDNHCAIVISYTGESAQAIAYARALKNSGTPILALTSVGNNTVASFADERLQIASQEKYFYKMAPFASVISITAIMNYLYAGIFALDYETNSCKRHQIVTELLKYQYVADSLRGERQGTF